MVKWAKKDESIQMTKKIWVCPYNSSHFNVQAFQTGIINYATYLSGDIAARLWEKSWAGKYLFFSSPCLNLN